MLEGCPECGGKLIHDVGGGMSGIKVSGWRCKNAFSTYKRPDPPCNYWIKDSGQNADFEEARLRVESRKDIRQLIIKRDTDALFE